MILKRIRIFYERFVSLKGEPPEIAAGLTLGVFVGVTPTIPFHTAIIVFLGLLLRKNITAAYLGSWLISNPFTIPILYVGQYELGRFVLGMDRFPFQIPDYTVGAIAALGWQILLPLLLGGILMAPVFAIPCYFIARRLIASIRERG
ncbi:MAG: DUF2062 domain-containing protein [Deltaproteobacteria bacterium]|nr:DUF2062 domain-containing protein [Deltaproteobacteria bacterium]